MCPDYYIHSDQESDHFTKTCEMSYKADLSCPEKYVAQGNIMGNKHLFFF